MQHIIASLKPYEQKAKQLEGWCLEYEPESLAGGTPWDYEALAANSVKTSQRVLDLGTGGGESFSRILKSKDCEAYATEEWHRNAPVAASRLKTIAPVLRCSSLQLPFASQTMDSVLSRHEAIDPSEVARVLKPGGYFLTQQVIHDFMRELKDYFPDTVIFEDFFTRYQQDLSALGLNVTRTEEFRYQIRFKELGHLVYQLVAAPWTVPGFSLETHGAGIALLSKKLKTDGELLFSAGCTLIEARSPE